MPSSRFELHPGAIEQLLRSPKSRSYKKAQGRKIADAWRRNINRVTGATERSIDVVEEGDQVIVEASTTRDPNSAWLWLEYGNGRMRAQHPGRRAIGEVRS